MKTILILGANGRIGFELSKFFLKEKCKLIAVDKNLSKFKSKNTLSLLKIKIDLSKEKNINLLIKKISNQKKIDGIVYCLYPKTQSWGISFEKVNEKHLKENLYFQLGMPILFLKNIYNLLVKKKIKSSIVMLSSIQGIRAPKFEHYKNLNMHSPIEYSASKAGIISITEYLAKYINNKDLRINCVSPGGILENQKKEFIRRYKKDCISKGLLDSKDLCATIKFLISEDSSYIRGQNIIIDDGWSL
jgi:NAD(P)-dependent dehydrogenase (short-subunit alcohol dehydrogenase family)